MEHLLTDSSITLIIAAQSIFNDSIIFQRCRGDDAPDKIIPGCRYPGHAERDQKRRSAVRRYRYHSNRYSVLALRPHTGQIVTRFVQENENAPDDLRRDGVRGLRDRTQAVQEVR